MLGVAGRDSLGTGSALGTGPAVGKARMPGMVLTLGIGLALTAGPVGAQLFNPPTPPPPAAADLILEGGKVYTPSGWAASIAIAKGVIVAAGDAGAMQPHRTPATRIIDLKGRTVLPGLHDMHVH